MPIFTQESLESVRQKIDLVEVLSSYLDLKKAGASYKALCPFHDEKSPSFMVQKGDSHYHCFGCGAHGDAIAFLMSHQKMTFVDAVETLAQRFQINLDYAENQNSGGANKNDLKTALNYASEFYHFMLLHTDEGQQALAYLLSRGLDLPFILQFQIGLAPKKGGLLRKVMHAKFVKDQTLADAGLIQPGNDGGWRDFFYDRITFPIQDPSGAVIGFSARKYKEETSGGKYVNTPETPLFKKSKVLFGLNYSRKRIAKERTAIIVEGQIDALRLIQSGFNFTVAGQGTAFGEGHAKELIRLGVQLVYLALDPDTAGQEAASKIGDFFLREGVEVKVAELPKGCDPDAFLKEKGPEAFRELLVNAQDFLNFLVRHESQKINTQTPTGKNELLRVLSQKIQSWNQPVIIHESLKKLALLLNIPENLLGMESFHSPNTYIKKAAMLTLQDINADQILETDFLRWLYVCAKSKPEFTSWAQANISADALVDPICRQFYQTLLEQFLKGLSTDLAALANQMTSEDSHAWFKLFFSKKINADKAEEQFMASMQKILDRNWMQKREQIKVKIQSGTCSDDEALELVRQFEDIKKHPPKISLNLNQTR